MAAGASVHNAAMADPASWHPIQPAHTVRAGAQPLAARLLGEDLVVWRSAAGVLQAWRAGCPHRGVHLALGRVVGERLACAYHGWEFEAGSGRCAAIPALADLAGVPGQVQATRCAVQAWGGMVWVDLQADSDPKGTAPPMPGTGDADPAWFARTLIVCASQAKLHAHLRADAFVAEAPAVWQGTLAGQALRLFTHPLQAGLAGAHAWWCQAPAPDRVDAALAALRRLRRVCEAEALPC
jgi:nitrite reductase/ring-hydroxylating ferredoxin subunit